MTPETSDAHQNVPIWPKIVAVVRADGSGEVTVNGASHPVQAADADEARQAVLKHVSQETATALGRPVRVETVDPDGRWLLVVHPDGRVDAAGQRLGGPVGPRRRHRVAEGAASGDSPPDLSSAGSGSTDTLAAQDDVTLDVPFRWTLAAAAVSPAPEAVGTPPSATPLAGRASRQQPAPAAVPTLTNLLETRPPAPAGPAQTGWQGVVRRLSGGIISPSPGAQELAHRDAVASVQRSLNGPKTIVVVNPKGGAHKTTATLLIAATFGIHRGGYTLAWDNNETRGTLGWRANPARHTNTAVDLLRDLDRFTDVRAARVGDLDNYVRSQGSAQFDVLASDEDAASAASIDAEAFNQLHRTLARFYRVMVVDTGNNMRASNWRAAVDAADQLVIVSTVREDTAQSAAWLIDALRAAGRQDAVRRAVTVLSAPAQTPDASLSRRLHDHFGQLTRTVLDIPHDPTLVPGGPITYEALTPASRSAWLRVTAAVADGL